MNMNIRKTFIASAIAALISAPAFAAEGVQYDGTAAPGKSQSGQPMRDQSTSGKPMGSASETGTWSDSGTAKNVDRDNPVYSRSPDSLDGVEVVDNAGEEIGKITSVVLAPDRHNAYAVISSGGMMGLGARDILVSLDELNTVGDKLQMAGNKENIQSREEYKSDGYKSEQYVELEGDKPISGSISEFSAFEPAKDSSKKPAVVPAAPESTR
jgi:sporulation protein YlmC with PRC-barrel domain